MELLKHWTLGRIADACHGRLLQGDPRQAVSSIAVDSRRIAKGELFWVIEGANKDGNDFVPDALASGALGALVSREPRPPASAQGAIILVRRGLDALLALAQAHRALFSQVTVVGVTGSNGKTTTREMIAGVLSQSGPVTSSRGNFNNEVGCPLSILELSEKHRFAVWEMGARKKGDIEPLSLAGKPQIVVLTNIAPAHLETFGDEKTIFETKSEILRGLEPGGQVIYGKEDPWLSRLPALWPGCGYLSFGFEPGADVQGRIKSRSAKGTLLEIMYQEKFLGEAMIPMTALGPMKNALAAAACGLAAKVPVKKILQGLLKFTPVSLRGDRIDLSPALAEQFVAINDAYNANPASMEDSVIGFLAGAREGTRIVVLGEMRELGSREMELHYQTGASIARQAKGAGLINERVVFVVTGRFAAERLAMGLNQEFGKMGPKVIFATRGEALELIKRQLFLYPPPGAVLFKASRAEALEELISDLKREF